MNIQINEEQLTPLNASKKIFLSVIEDVNYNFDRYARLFIKNFDDLNDEEIRQMYDKRLKIYETINKALAKEKIV